MSHIIRKIIPLIILLGLAGGAFYYYKKHTILQPEQLYRLQEITQGEIGRAHV